MVIDVAAFSSEFRFKNSPSPPKLELPPLPRSIRTEDAVLAMLPAKMTLSAPAPLEITNAPTEMISFAAKIASLPVPVSISKVLPAVTLSNRRNELAEGP